jgi:putative transposase
MSKLLRYFAPGQYCFITTVTANRLPILNQHAELLARAVQKTREKSRFAVIAWVVLPDHIHAVLHTPHGDTSRIVQQVKLSFSLQYQRLTGRTGPIWQHRYWDHIVRSDEDMRRHIDYIHYNPVKHGLTDSPDKWVLSSFQRYLRSGLYRADWGEKPIVTQENTFRE